MQRFLILLSLIAASISDKAFSIIDIDAPEPVLVAQEAIKKTDYVAQQLQITSSGSVLYVQSIAGFSLHVDYKYARFEFTNAVLGAALPSTGLDSSVSFTSILEVGGAIGDNYAVIGITSASLQPRTTPIVLPITSLRIVDASQPVGITYTLYDNASEAIYGGVELYQSSAELVKVVPALGEFFTDDYVATADFSEDFLRFVPTFRSPSSFQLGDSTDTLASLGHFLADRLVIDNVRNPSDLNVVTDFRDLLQDVNPANPIATLSGDTSSANVFLHSTFDCASGTSFTPDLAEDIDSDVFTFSLDQLVATPYLCVEALSETEAIRRTTLYLDLGIGLQAQVLGIIEYDAAAADLPYLTTFDAYRQRLILTNYTGQDISYLIEVNADTEASSDSIELTPLSRGVIPANSTLKLNSTDIIEIAPGNPTRVSGRIYFDADVNDVSAAVQILAFGSQEPPTTNVLTIKAL